MTMQWLTDKKHQCSNNEPAVRWEELALVVDEHVGLDQELSLDLDDNHVMRCESQSLTCRD